MVTAETTKVWRSPTKGRRYLTRKGAIHAEAKAKIMQRYPVEKCEYSDIGYMTYPGYHFPSSEPERYEKMLRRLKRIIDEATER
ncbi:hypothetical protein [Yersinia kristensenii]|uniref:hypothetical protein n=1 Tax=Yersinia kristensenii TaxID=28152 RepID=UPI00156208AA|nr:hypothetical protein [Yersinia kristensenii]QKJ17330.1 hypothetical protein HRD70_20395 [Yersinia kristensenii]